MVGLCASATAVRTLASLLFVVGLAEMMIHIQKLAASDYSLGSPYPLVMSVFSMVTGSSGMFLIHKEFIPRSVAFAAITAVTSMITFKETHSLWSDLRPMKSCSNWVQSSDTRKCMNFSDYSIRDQPIRIPERYQLSKEDDRYRDRHSEVIQYKPGLRINSDSAPVVTPSSESAIKQHWHSYFNGSFYSNEFADDIACYGDEEYFAAAYYCSFWLLAQDIQRSDHCYCVSESQSDGSATCHEFQPYPYCNELLGSVKALELSMLILSVFSFCMSVIHFTALLLLFYYLWSQKTVLNYYDIFDDWRALHSFKKAAAHISHEGVVLTQAAEAQDPLPPLRMDNNKDSDGVSTMLRSNRVAPLEENRVRNFEDPDEDIPNAHSVRTPTAASLAAVTPRAAARAQQPTVPALSIAHTIGTGLIGLVRRYLGIERVMVADPVTPRRRLFRHRVAPIEAVDAQLDVANVIPYPHAVPFEGDRPPRPQINFF